MLNSTQQQMTGRKLKTRNTHRLFALRAETVAALKAGDLQLVSIIDKTI